MNNVAPIIVLVYNRFEHFKKCIGSLQENALSSESVIYIVSDAASTPEDEIAVNQIREFALSITGFKEKKYLFRKKNLGAHDSCDEAIKEVLSENDSFIILEDDIFVAPNFLRYMNDGLLFYKNDYNIFSICGFKLPFALPPVYNKEVYFYPGISPWGFATWKERWESVNFGYENRYAKLKEDKKMYKKFLSIGFYIKGILIADSKQEIVAGDLRIYYHMFKNNMASVFPIVSKSQNWGYDGSGLHCGNKNAFWAKPSLDMTNQQINFIPFTGFDEVLLKNHRRYSDKINGGIFAKYLKYTWVHDIYKYIKKISHMK